MKKLITFCLFGLAFNSALAESIDMSLSATKNVAGLGHQVLSLDPEKLYKFTCQLTPKEIPPAGTIFLDIKVCDHTKDCPYAYAEGHADLKQPFIQFNFTPQQEYIGEKTNFSVIMQYIPINDHQGALARYDLFCTY
jgi:hypothetical protein